MNIKERAIAQAQRVLEIEAEAVVSLKEKIDDNFYEICELLKQCTGRIVVTGMGKSGHIGHKIAATLASTGTPSFFMHPAEASHGDLGMITKEDVVLALSNSGETDELIAIIPILIRQGTSVVSITGNDQSTLAKNSSFHLLAKVKEEACPLNLAPTSSTTAALALGDAIAVTLMEMRGFTSDDFARSHPGGKLGRRLLLRVQDIMAPYEEIAEVSEEHHLTDALLEMTKYPLGIIIVTDNEQTLKGVFSEGDLRRTLTNRTDIHELTMKECMTATPKYIHPAALAVDAANLMEEKRISALPVLDMQNKVLGVVTMHHLLQARVM
ncbi:KpsF/GutQ family sugar-phosphate isomerase [Wohlfahrtiimonas larvae]|uniref:Arabinose 5-phosphate isomerase n=1 Tax=Wohlfahrtiimonas larvae TaxID=1157986 RepID=A0ABP9MMG8_9GAMM|nr:KpsF/GutQ family sugar-phosphate isomerase [Wohlfahrtiimonas larvae]